MIPITHYILIIGAGAIFIALAYGDKKGIIRINNSGLEFAIWIIVIILFWTLILPKALMIM